VSLVLIDTSTWARARQSPVADRIADVIDANLVAIVGPLTLELLRSARDLEELRLLGQYYDSLHQVPLTSALTGRAREVLEALAARGYHRGPSPVDLLAAAAAESIGAELWHCDRDFELIADVTGQPVLRVGR
jgi:predicted nucleic acid-binding protein